MRVFAVRHDGGVPEGLARLVRLRRRRHRHSHQKVSSGRLPRLLPFHFSVSVFF